MVMGNFYDKVAEKFGQYTSGVEYDKEFPEGDPEEVFKALLLKAGSKTSRVLDVGCADGRFTLQVAPHFGEVVGADTSDGMLAVARKFKAEAGAENVKFEKIDVFDNGLPAESFDIIYSRRGPTPYPEFFRLLKPGGLYFGIRIGNLDTRELKETFGRGQNYDNMDVPVLKSDSDQLENAGFKVTFAKEFRYNVYYKSIEGLSRALESVPIFEDYDPVKDRPFLEKYVGEHSTVKGIDLPRHRAVLVAVKK